MRIDVPQHRFSIDLGDEWELDETSEEVVVTHGIYVRSKAQGVFMNVRPEANVGHVLTEEGMVALVAEQKWASPPFDTWTDRSSNLSIAGGTFETVDMQGELVLEAFVTDRISIVNFAGPAERSLLAHLTPSVRRLAKTVRFAERQR